MGGPSRKASAANGNAGGAGQHKPEEIVEDVDFKGLSLEDFVAEERTERRLPLPVHTHSAQSVEECMSSVHALLLSAHRIFRRPGEGQI